MSQVMLTASFIAMSRRKLALIFCRIATDFLSTLKSSNYDDITVIAVYYFKAVFFIDALFNQRRKDVYPFKII